MPHVQQSKGDFILNRAQIKIFFLLSVLEPQKRHFLVFIRKGVKILARLKSLADASGRTLALADPAPMAEVSSLDSSAIALTVRAWCRTADYWDVFFGGNQAVKQAFDKAGVAIPFPRMDVHIKQA